MIKLSSLSPLTLQHAWLLTVLALTYIMLLQ